MPTLAEFLIDSLQQRGIKHVFGLTGDYSSNLMNKLYKSSLEVVPTTSELSAGIAADAYARVNGLGAVCVTYCVGGFRLLDAIAGAYAEKSPVVVISGSPGIKERNSKLLLHHMVGHFECQHDMFAHITCANTVLRDPDRAGYEIDRVLNAALTHKQPVYIEVPRDMVDKSIRYDVLGGVPQDIKTDEQSLQESLSEVINWINSSTNPVIWAGVEVSRYGFGKALTKFAEQANIPIVTTVLGKSCVDERHPLVYGVYCENIARDDIKEMINKCDCLIMLGVMMTDANFGFMPAKYQRRNIILATSSTTQVRNHTYQDVTFTDFMTGLLKTRINRRECYKIEKPVEREWKAEPGKPLTVIRLFDKIKTILSSNMAIVADVGDSLFGALNIPVHDSHLFLSDAFYSSMGWSIPAALGVQTAKPNIRPIVLCGDGSFQITGMEMSTLVKRKLNPIIFVLNNGGYGTERLAMDGTYNDIHNWQYEKLPLVFGGLGIKVTKEEELDKAIAEALAANQPVIINCVIDPNDHAPALKKVFGKVK